MNIFNTIYLGILIPNILISLGRSVNRYLGLENSTFVTDSVQNNQPSYDELIDHNDIEVTYKITKTCSCVPHETL